MADVVVDFKIIVVSDSHGHVDACVVNDLSENVMICGMFDSFMNDAGTFEGEGYHLSSWCKIHDLKLSITDHSNTVVI